jgi:hypothetical protein
MGGIVSWGVAAAGKKQNLQWASGRSSILARGWHVESIVEAPCISLCKLTQYSTSVTITQPHSNCPSKFLPPRLERPCLRRPSMVHHIIRLPSLFIRLQPIAACTPLAPGPMLPGALLACF